MSTLRDDQIHVTVDQVLTTDTVSIPILNPTGSVPVPIPPMPPEWTEEELEAARAHYRRVDFRWAIAATTTAILSIGASGVLVYWGLGNW